MNYADPKNEKYPIDTEKHIRAAWSYINMPKNQKEYSSGEVAAIKNKIVAAWKDKIDKDGPPSASEKNQAIDGLAGALTALRTALKEMASRANKSLQVLPPLEQFEKTSPIYSAILSTGSALDWIEDSVKFLDGQLDAIDPAAAAQAAANEMLEARLDMGELITTDDAATAATKAADDRETAVRLEIQTVEQRRKELSTKNGDKEPLLSPEVAARLSVDLLKADDYLARATKIAGRVTELNELGIDVPQLLNAAADTPLDETGDTQFNERLTLVKEISEKAGKAKGKDDVTAPEPLAGGGGAQNNAEELVGVF